MLTCPPAQVSCMGHRGALDNERGEYVVIVPTLNEERAIEACLSSLLAQVSPDCEVLVVDGGSTDQTAAIVAGLQVRHGNLRFFHNPKKLQAAAINQAARIADARAKYLIRADAHCVYPPTFIADCIRALKQTGATSVVVPMLAVGDTRRQRAIAAAQRSILGNGGATHRSVGVSGFVDHGHHAAFERTFFMAQGGYDENLSHYEDVDFDHRTLQNGGRIWMCAEAAVSYLPRRTFRALARQYFNYGRGRALTALRGGPALKPRHLMLPAILPTLLGSSALTAVHPGFFIILAAYVLLCTVWSLCAAIRSRDMALLAMGFAAMVMQISWASGFAAGCLATPHRLAGSSRTKQSIIPEPAVAERKEQGQAV